MQIADNTLAAMSDFFHRQLDDEVGSGEAAAVFRFAAWHLAGLDPAKTAASERLNQSQIISLYDCAKKVKAGMPVQYAVGYADFLGLQLSVTGDVLIPRPETEELTDRIIRREALAGSFLDIGTGSGCIAVSLAHHLNAAEVFACDVSRRALEVARRNARKNGVTVHFLEADVLSSAFAPPRPVEVIVSNPPYILPSESIAMDKRVTAFEPHLALFTSGSDEIQFYRAIARSCVQWLVPGGRVYLELNPLTAGQVKELFSEQKIFTSIQLEKDLSGKTRFIIAEKTGG